MDIHTGTHCTWDVLQGARRLSWTTGLGARAQKEWAVLTLTVSQRRVGCGSFLQLHVWLPHLLPVSWVLGKLGSPLKGLYSPGLWFFSRRKGHRLSPKRITTILYHSAQWLLLAMSSPHLKISLCQAAHSAPSTHRLTKSSQRLSKLSALVLFILERIVEVQGCLANTAAAGHVWLLSTWDILWV